MNPCRCPSCGQPIADERGFIIDPKAMTVRRGEVVERFGEVRFDIFAYYYRKFGTPVAYERAVAWIWQLRNCPHKSTLFVHLNHMRERLNRLGVEIVGAEGPHQSKFHFMRFVKE